MNTAQEIDMLKIRRIINAFFEKKYFLSMLELL